MTRMNAVDVLHYRVTDRDVLCTSCRLTNAPVLIKGQSYCQWCALNLACCFISGTQRIEKLKRQEPGLRSLERQIRVLARGVKPGQTFCANFHWRRTFRPILMNLIKSALHRSDSLLSYQSKELITSHLYNLLPDCNHAQGICK
jgi:hypothetical protein